MAKAISVGMQAHLDGEVTSLATCWGIKRRDGVTQFLTDHDQDITVIEGQTLFNTPILRFLNATYSSVDGFERKSVSNRSQSTDTSNLTAILNSTGVNENDIRAGLYDGARVYIFLVNWANLADGVVRLPGSGIIGEVELMVRTGTYSAEVRGLGHFFQNRYGQLYTPTCKVDMFSTRCRVDESLHVQHGVVATVTDNRQFNAKDSAFSAFTTTALTITNQDFENEVASTPGITGWTGILEEDANEPGAGMWRTDNFAFAPDPSAGVQQLHPSGDAPHTKFVEFEIKSDSTTIPLGGPGPVAADIDNGEAVINLTVALANDDDEVTNDDFPKIGLEFLDTLGDTISEVLSAEINFLTHAIPIGAVGTAMTDYTRVFNVPPNSRSVRIRLIGINGAGSAIQTHYDNVRAEVAAITVLTLGTDRDAMSLTDWFDHGFIRMTSGANAGLSREIETYDDTSNDEVVLFFPLPFTLAVGDTFEIYPGCKKRWAIDCGTKWDNAINFQGEPHVPAQDKAFETPNAK